MNEGYDVRVRAEDQRTGRSDSPRAFPSGAKDSYSAAISLPSGEMHWVHVTISGRSRARIVGGTKLPGNRYMLKAIHDSVAELADDRATVSYVVDERLTITVTIAPRAPARVGPQSSQDLMEQLAAVPKKKQPKQTPARSLIRSFDARTISRLRRGM